MAFYIRVQAQSKIASGPFTDMPKPKTGYTSRLITDAEKLLCDSRRGDDILIDDQSGLHLATNEEKSALLPLREAILVLCSTVTDPSRQARIWATRVTLEFAYANAAPIEVIRAMMEGLNFSDDIELDELKDQILALPQWGL